MAKKITTTQNQSTEEKIKDAACKVFSQKGYAATRTRDIAEEAGINLALLNYYFRSKENLFKLVMKEKIKLLFSLLKPIIEDPSTTLEKKVELMVNGYIDMLTVNAELPLFVLSEMREHASQLNEILPIQRTLPKSCFMEQVREKRPDINPLHFFMNILGLTIYPFIAGHVFEVTGILKKENMAALFEERRKLIPVWVKAMLKAK